MRLRKEKRLKIHFFCRGRVRDRLMRRLHSGRELHACVLCKEEYMRFKEKRTKKVSAPSSSRYSALGRMILCILREVRCMCVCREGEMR